MAGRERESTHFYSTREGGEAREGSWPSFLWWLSRLSVPSNGSKPRKVLPARSKASLQAAFSTLERVEAKEGCRMAAPPRRTIPPFSTLERVEAKEGQLCKDALHTASLLSVPSNGSKPRKGRHTRRGVGCPPCFQYPRTGRSQGRFAVRARWCAAPALSVPSNGSKPRKESALRCC